MPSSHSDTLTIGASYTTGTVHLAHATGPTGQLTQLCGMGRRQLAYLAPAPTAAVTCKRCLALPQATEARA